MTLATELDEDIDDDTDETLLSLDVVEVDTDAIVLLLDEGITVALLVAVEAQDTAEGRFVTPELLQRFCAYVVAAS